MSPPRPPSGGGSNDALLRELASAAQRVDALLRDGPDARQARELTAVRATLTRAHHALDSQDAAVRDLGHSVALLARELLHSHARFGEWMDGSTAAVGPSVAD